MPLKAGDLAPELHMSSCRGMELTLSHIPGYKLLVFYKISCPTCQLTLPFIEKMYKSYGSAVKFLGVSQDNCNDTKNFCRKYELNFEQVTDEPSYLNSIACDVQVVPTLYLFDDSNRVIFVEEGFVKESMKELNRTLASMAGMSVNPLFEDVSVPAFKAG